MFADIDKLRVQEEEEEMGEGKREEEKENEGEHRWWGNLVESKDRMQAMS